MDQDSELFLREPTVSSGFAARRMERRMGPGAWRTPHGAVLRLLPDRLATLAAEVRAAMPPAHPAAADPHTAVREHVGALARAARPAGTVADRATGRPLHVFRAPGRVGEMEIVTAPPRGVIFDIVEVRPKGMQGELEVYQYGARGWQDPDTGLRVRGAHAKVEWRRIEIPNLPVYLEDNEVLNCVYILSRQQPEHAEMPVYVGIAKNLKKRWAPRLDALKLFDVRADDAKLWVGVVVQAPNRVHRANIRVDRDELIRKDIEHVLIRTINNRRAAIELAQRMAGGDVTKENVLARLHEMDAIRSNQHAAAQEVINRIVGQHVQYVSPEEAEQLLLLLARNGLLKPVYGNQRLKNSKSVGRIVSDPYRALDQGGGVVIENRLAENENVRELPWFLSIPIERQSGEEFEFPLALLGAST